MEEKNNWINNRKNFLVKKEKYYIKEIKRNKKIKTSYLGEIEIKIIEERYQLKDVTTDSIKNSIKKIIYSHAKEDSPLRRELDNMFDEKPKFFQEEYILQKNKRSKKRVLSHKYYYISRYMLNY